MAVRPTGSLPFDDLLARLRSSAAELEAPHAWPREQFDWLAAANVLRWVIPAQYTGIDATPLRLLEGYEQLAAACLVTTFVLTQRNGACQRLAGDEVDPVVQQEFLPPLAAGELFATVGISHLSTSRQHIGQPAVRIRRDGDDLLLAGDVPWVTGGPQADLVVTGGTFEDGRQGLVLLPTAERGVICGPPAALLSLTASQTASLTLDDVRLPGHYLLAGPAEGIMRRGAGGTGSITTSALAAGVASRAIEALRSEASLRRDLLEPTTALSDELTRLRSDLRAAAAASDERPACSPADLRKRANSLVLRSAQAWLTASKGAGFVTGHPAERTVREALFFLVWSCPQPVAAAALRHFACLGG
ncbi:MAG: acyl-CoA dehydrogenase family protein [Planctomycetaceae bacterium]